SFGGRRPRVDGASSYQLSTSIFSICPSRLIASALHNGRGAAVEVDRRARDEGGAVGGQERDEIAELVGLTDATDRHSLPGLSIVRVHVAALVPALPLRALHDPDADGVHEDLVWRVFFGERLREVDAGRARHARPQSPGLG